MDITSVSLTVDGIPAAFGGLGPMGDCGYESGVWVGHNYPAYFDFGPLDPGVYTIQTVHSNTGGLLTGPDWDSPEPHYWTEVCVITAE